MYSAEEDPPVSAIILCLFLLTLFSSLPLLAYAMFKYGGEENARIRGIMELIHLDLLTEDVLEEIHNTSDNIYKKENYGIALPLATLSLAVGWILFFFWKDPAIIRDMTPESILCSPVNSHPVVIGFLGVVFWVLGTLLRRYIRGDITEKVYIQIAIRFWSVLILTVVITLIFSEELVLGEDEMPNQALIAVSFLIGIFPNIGLELIKSTALKAGDKINFISADSDPFKEITGLTVWDQQRLLEEGINNVQNLANCDLFGLTIRTRFSYMTLINWVDQALLLIHTAGDFRKKLVLVGIKCASDLEAAYVGQLKYGKRRAIESSLKKEIKRANKHFSYMGRQKIGYIPQPPGSLVAALGGDKARTANTLRTVMVAICDDVNYQRLWQLQHRKFKPGDNTILKSHEMRSRL